MSVRRSSLIGLGAVLMAAGAIALVWIVTVEKTTGRWRLMLERPLQGKYEDFAFPNSESGWLISSRGDILFSADGGRSWAVQASGMGRLRSIHFLDAHRGFAGSLDGRLFATSDGGQQWTDITARLPRRALGICGITHAGGLIHIVGRYVGGAADYFVSSDSGRTFSATDLRHLADGLVDVMFVSSAVGFIGGMARSDPSGSGSAIVLKTTDGGSTWRSVFRHDGARGFAWKLFRASESTIFAALQSQDGVYRVAKSEDGGESWEVQIVASGRPLGPGVQAVGFIDERVGWVGGFFLGLYETRDGGASWAAIESEDRAINRFERVGSSIVTASSRGVLKYQR